MAARAKEGRAEVMRAGPPEPSSDEGVAEIHRRASTDCRLVERVMRPPFSSPALREKGAPLVGRSTERHAARSSAASFGLEWIHECARSSTLATSRRSSRPNELVLFH